MDQETPRFAVFYRFFWPCNPFRMNTSRKLSQVFILNNLQETLSPLESAFTEKRGGGASSGSSQTQPLSLRCFKVGLELFPEQSSGSARKPSASRCEAQACPGATIAP